MLLNEWLLCLCPPVDFFATLNCHVFLSLSARRALFDYDGSASDLSAPNQALPFKFGDILHVSSAGEEEWWPARHLSPPPPNSPEVGVIPSRRRSESKGSPVVWFYWLLLLRSASGRELQSVIHDTLLPLQHTYAISSYFDLIIFMLMLDPHPHCSSES